MDDRMSETLVPLFIAVAVVALVILLDYKL